jgi:hypothetical protein
MTIVVIVDVDCSTLIVKGRTYSEVTSNGLMLTEPAPVSASKVRFGRMRRSGNAEDKR